MAIGVVKLTPRDRFIGAMIFVALGSIQALLGLIVTCWSSYICVVISPATYTERAEVTLVFAVIAIFGTHVLLHGLFGIKICHKCYKQAHKKSTKKIIFVWTLVGCNVLIDVFILASMAKKVSRHIVEALARTLENGMEYYLKDQFWKYTIDSLQVKMHCCGVYDYKDWYQLLWIDEHQIHMDNELVTQLRLSKTKPKLPITPWSCCNIDYPMQCFHDPFQQTESSYLWKEEPEVVENSIYSKGCLSILKEPIEKALTGFIVITIFIFIFMIAAILISRIVYTSCRNNLILQHSSGIAPGWIFGRGDFGWARGPTLDELMMDVPDDITKTSLNGSKSASKSKSSDKKTRFTKFDKLSNFSKMINKQRKALKHKKFSQKCRSDEEPVSSGEEKALMLH